MNHKINKKRKRGAMLTERYVVTVFGINTQYYTDEFIAYLWEESADEEYNKSSIYVTALIDARTLVCGKNRGCDLGDTAYVISCLRNPVDNPDSDDYWNAFRRIILSIRVKLDNPAMTVTIQNADYYFFLKES